MAESHIHGPIELWLQHSTTAYWLLPELYSMMLVSILGAKEEDAEEMRVETGQKQPSQKRKEGPEQCCHTAVPTAPGCCLPAA